MGFGKYSEFDEVDENPTVEETPVVEVVIDKVNVPVDETTE